MSAEDVLRLAWQADRDGRARMRDELLMLAVAESGPEGAVSAERCRKLLVAGRPEHWFTSFPTIGQALGHPRVAREIDRLRVTYPPARILQLLLRGDVRRGPYTGRGRSLSGILDDLGGVRVPAGPGQADEVTQALPFSTGNALPASKVERDDDPAGLLTFYLTVLMAIAILLASVQPPAAQDTRAA